MSKQHPAVAEYLSERARKAGQVRSQAKTDHCRELAQSRVIQDEFTDLPISRQAKYNRRKAKAAKTEKAR